jgi:hypothetical protein
MNTLAPTQAINFDVRVSQYVKLRDKIKAIKEKHKEELSPFEDMLETLEGVLLSHLDQVGGDSVRSESGTVYRSTKHSASIADMNAFWGWVQHTPGGYDMVDKRANVTAIREYMEEFKQPVPGVNVTSMHTVGVRRAATTKK